MCQLWYIKRHNPSLVTGRVFCYNGKTNSRLNWQVFLFSYSLLMMNFGNNWNFKILKSPLFPKKCLVLWMKMLALKILTLKRKSIFKAKLHKKFTWCIWHVTSESFMQFCFEKIHLLPMMLKFIYSEKASKNLKNLQIHFDFMY